MKLSISIDDALIRQVDRVVDNKSVKSRSHAIELLLRRSLQKYQVSKAFILAGGKGTRLRPITTNLPKPLIPIAGKPLMERTIEWLKANNITDIIISVGYMGEKIVSHFKNGEDFGVRINYVWEDAEHPLGTAGPLRLAKEYLNSTFLMLNGDILSELSLEDMIAFHRNNNSPATIALTTVEDPSRFGVAKMQGTRITGFVEKPKIEDAPSKLINAGIYLLEPEIIEFVPKGPASMENDVFPLLAKRDSLSGYIYTGPWFDIGILESLEAANKFFGESK